MIKLINACKNNKYIIKQVSQDYFFCRRLTDMGFTKGTVVFVCALAPLNGAVLVNIRGVNIALRDDAAKSILVAPIKA